LFETPDASNASVVVPERYTLQPPTEKPTTPVIQATPQVQVPSPEQFLSREEKTKERPVPSVPEETKSHLMTIQVKLKRLIEEM